MGEIVIKDHMIRDQIDHSLQVWYTDIKAGIIDSIPTTIKIIQKNNTKPKTSRYTSVHRTTEHITNTRLEN